MLGNNVVMKEIKQMIKHHHLKYDYVLIMLSYHTII